MTVPNPRRQLLVLIGVLGAALLVALWPFVSGILGAAVLYILFRPVFVWLRGWLSPRFAAALVVCTALVILVAPGLAMAGLVVNETQEIAGRLADRPVFGQLTNLRIGPVAVGPYLMRGAERLVDWLGSSAFDLVGRAARGIINLVIAMFGLFYLLMRSHDVWAEVATYLPFSSDAALRLRRRFHDLTWSTIIGTGLTAIAQGTLLGTAFALVGVKSPLFWGIVTAMFATIPFVGSGFVWGPAVVALIALDRYGAALAVGVWGAFVVATVDNFIRPFVYSRWANVHPMVTVVGVVAGVRLFGVLGVLLGPMALSCLLEFIRIYRDEYATPEAVSADRTL